MGEESLPANPSDRAVEQAIVTLKKGAQLLKYGRRGKPKFCPFRLSMDEKVLIWYSGQEERQLRLSSITNVIHGHKTKQIQPDRECQSISLVVANGERTLDLICKDKAQADTWFLGLRTIISRRNHPRLSSTSENGRWAQSCINSPAGYMRRKRNLGLPEEITAKISQVRSLAGSPPQSFSERCFSDGFSCSSNSFYSQSSLSTTHNIMDMLTPDSPYIEPNDPNNRGAIYESGKNQTNMLNQFMTPDNGLPNADNHVLGDVLIWGEGIESGCLGGGFNKISYENGMTLDALLPKLIESTTMLDVQKISLGGKHAALATKQGEVFCWGDARGGRLGHKVNMDITSPKVVESLTGVNVSSVFCGEYQTCALTLSGECYVWGDCFHGADLADVDMTRNQWVPHRLSGIMERVIISSVACGEWHTAIVCTSGQLFTYGDGTFGVLGHGNLENVSEPKEVESLKGLRVKSVACGPWHTAAVVDIMIDRFKFNDPSGKLFTWGDGDKGRLGHPDQEKKLLPKCVAQLVDHDFVQVSCGRMLTVGLTNVGTIYTMGSMVHGQMGNPQAIDKSITIVQGKLKHEFVKSISSGSFHTAALTSRGKVYTWGKGANGQLGLGSKEDRSSPALVEALRDRQVESISCGSNSTAAICLHKSISCTDQSACRGCSMAFGFARKKHNCYNCGLLFCRACSNRKAVNASLAPDKSRPFRVCVPCFNHLQRTAYPELPLKTERFSPRPVLNKQKRYLTEQNLEKDVTLTRSQMTAKTYFSDDRQCHEMRTIKDQGEYIHPLDTNLSFSSGLPRWGQVPLSAYFGWNCGEQKLCHPQATRDPLSSISPMCSHDMPFSSISASCNIASVKRQLELDQNDMEEVQELRAQVEVLEKLCETNKEKIEEQKSKTEESWLLAKAEAAKLKAAKEVIQALTSRLHIMSERITAGRELKDQPSANLSQIVPICTDTPTLKNVHPMFAVRHTRPAVGELEDKGLDSVCSTPYVLSSKTKSTHNGEVKSNDSRSVEELCYTKVRYEQKEISEKVEWVEQYRPGVYITFTTLPSGQKGLKRVRFSRRKFSDKEAAVWWEENQVHVYQNYGIEGYISSNDDTRKW